MTAPGFYRVQYRPVLTSSIEDTCPHLCFIYGEHSVRSVDAPLLVTPLFLIEIKPRLGDLVSLNRVSLSY